MKNSKRFICAFMAAIMAVCAAGCGSNESEIAKSEGVEKSVDKSVGAVAEDYAEDVDTAMVDGDFGEIVDDGFSEEYAAVDDAVAIDEGAIDTGGEAANGEVSENSEAENAIGVLTAGEWNDNDNWGFFSNLVSAGTIAFPSYGIDPCERTKVTVTDDSGEPIANANVVLKSGEEIVWSAVSDKDGTAYLFGEGGEIVVSDGEISQSFEVESEQKSGEQGSAQMTGSEITLTFNGESKLNKKTEIMFIVDSTGSMSDEMLFLQSEFGAIAREVGTDNTRYSVNFYRDEGDEYVTKCSGFSSDIEEIQNTLNSESADGGGDFPEAVDRILTETLTEGDWSEDSVKIAFLIFDAPPHSGTEEALQTAIKAAAEKGIRLVPVVSSNSERDTELFARAIAICTGGTYVFLTDDSGIGESHLEPIIGDYETEKLYDIIIRIIGEYRN